MNVSLRGVRPPPVMKWIEKLEIIVSGNLGDCMRPPPKRQPHQSVTLKASTSWARASWARASWARASWAWAHRSGEVVMRYHGSICSEAVKTTAGIDFGLGHSFPLVPRLLVLRARLKYLSITPEVICPLWTWL